MNTKVLFAKKKKSCAVQSSECESLENFLSP